MHESSAQPSLGMSAGVTSLEAGRSPLNLYPRAAGTGYCQFCPFIPCLRWAGVHGEPLLLWGALAPGILRAPCACGHLT